MAQFRAQVKAFAAAGAVSARSSPTSRPPPAGGNDSMAADRGSTSVRVALIPLPAPAPLSLNHCLKATCGDAPGTASRNCQPIRSSDPHSLGPLPSPSIVPSVLLTAVRRTAFCWRSLVA